VLQLAYSADGSAWEDLPYTVTTQDFSADHSMYFLLVTGETDSGAQAGLFRLTLNPGDLPPSQVQVGHVRLVGRKSALRSD
jgi:hypothetical protein